MATERFTIDPVRGRDQWLELRKSVITASDVAAVCGEGMYSSAGKVWAEKKGLIAPAELNAAMVRGLWGEAAVFTAIEWENPDWEVRRAKVFIRDLERRIGATPDGAVIIPGRPGVGIIQTKVIAKPVFMAEWLADPEDEYSKVVPPLGYQLQTLTEACLGEADYGVIAALVVDTFRWRLVHSFIERNADAERTVFDRVMSFCTNYLDTGIQPPIEPERDEDLVKKLYPRDVGSTIDLTGDNEIPVLVDDLELARAHKKDAESREKIAKTAIAAKIGEHSYGVMADGRKISHKLQHRDGYPVPPTSFRVLRIAKGR